MTARLRRLALLVVAAPALVPAAAHATPVGSGTTTLTVDKAAARALAANSVRVPRTTRFAIRGGDIDPSNLGGTILHRGSLRITRHRRSVTIASPVVAVGPHSALTALIRGKRVAAFTLDVSRSKTARTGTTTEVRDIAVALTPAGAKAIDAALGGKAVASGARLGALSVVVRAADWSFAGGDLDLDLAAALAPYGVTVAPGPDALSQPGGTIGLPIGSGDLAFGTLGGRVFARGAIVLTGPAGQLTLSAPVFAGTTKTLEFAIDTGGAVPLVAFGGFPAPVQSGLSFTLGPLDAALTVPGAQLLAQRLGAPVSANAPLGSVTLRGRLH